MIIYEFGSRPKKAEKFCWSLATINLTLFLNSSICDPFISFQEKSFVPS